MSADCWPSFEPARIAMFFLATLPTFASVSSLAGLVTELNTAIHMLCMGRVNSAAALQVRPCFANTMVYPLLVLLNAISISQGIPLIFFVGVVHTFINSVLNKTAFVRMGRWKSRSRHWWVGTANVGKGKSPGMKTFVNVMIEVLSRNASKAVGFAGDRFQFQHSGITASALDKLRASQAYLTIYCPDATRVLCPAVATGGTTGPYKYVDLGVFLDAAHGDEVSLTTQRFRNKVAKQKVSNPQAPVMPQQGIHMDPTNVHIMLLQQEVIFANWWCQMIPKKTIGIAQRCLFSFGGDSDPAPMDLHAFMDAVTVPIIRTLFELVVRHVGPVMTQAEEPHYDCTDQQNAIVGELETILRLHGRHAHVSECFRSALPKAMYWLGTALLMNHTIGTLWQACLHGQDVDSVCGNISDQAFAASVRFMYAR
jgi:hypothetical protein